jgi:hypothetical protein
LILHSAAATASAAAVDVAYSSLSYKLFEKDAILFLSQDVVHH